MSVEVKNELRLNPDAILVPFFFAFFTAPLGAVLQKTFPLLAGRPKAKNFHHPPFGITRFSLPNVN